MAFLLQPPRTGMTGIEPCSWRQDLTSHFTFFFFQIIFPTYFSVCASVYVPQSLSQVCSSQKTNCSMQIAKLGSKHTYTLINPTRQHVFIYLECACALRHTRESQKASYGPGNQGLTSGLKSSGLRAGALICWAFMRVCVREGAAPLCRCWELNPGLLEKHLVLLSAESSI